MLFKSIWNSGHTALSELYKNVCGCVTACVYFGKGVYRFCHLKVLIKKGDIHFSNNIIKNINIIKGSI